MWLNLNKCTISDMIANYPCTQLLKLASYELIKMDKLWQRKYVYLPKPAVLHICKQHIAGVQPLTRGDHAAVSQYLALFLPWGEVNKAGFPPFPADRKGTDDTLFIGPDWENWDGHTQLLQPSYFSSCLNLIITFLHETTSQRKKKTPEW